MPFKDYDLEERCIRPGLWGIEGYYVVRVATERWAIRNQTDGVDGKNVTTKRTLTGCRHWIAMETIK
jgi:hypothetical protein